MHSTLEFLVHNGYLVLLVWVFLEQAGLPLPSVPLLLAAGALGGMHRLNFGLALLLCTLAAVSADTIWYQLGKRKGIRILHLLCRISLEPTPVCGARKVSSKNRARNHCCWPSFLPGFEHCGHAARRPSFT